MYISYRRVHIPGRQEAALFDAFKSTLYSYWIPLGLFKIVGQPRREG